MFLTNNNHFRNLSAFSKRSSQNHHKKNDLYRFGLKNSNSKTTLQVCHTDRSQSQVNQTLNHLGISQQMQSPRLAQFHIKAFIRFRPQKIINAPTHQQGNINKKIAIIDKKKILCEDNFFTYDHVFEPPTQQQQIYNNVCKQMVQHFVRGFNSTVFAYGQTGSGKTYTMFGDLYNQSKKGIIPSAIKDIFASVRQISNQLSEGFTNQVIVSCSMLQIYKQTMIDLLSNEKGDLKIKQNQFFNVSNLTIKQVGNQQEMNEVLKIGNQSKKMRQTCMNQASSRSHVIFTIYLEVRKQHQKRLSKFNLVDLAGSQKVSKSKVQGEGLQQAKKINLSLSCLGNTINALLKRNDHIPYRESKLTRLLYESLGGNSLTRLIVTCSSEDTQIQQTLSSLKFAARAKNLKTNPLINTLRKSQKSVSRIAYQNLKTNLNKAEYKINKIKSLVNELKSQSQYQSKSHSVSIHDKQNQSIFSNTQIDWKQLKQNQFLKSQSVQLNKLKHFVQKLQNILNNSNKDLINQFIQKPKIKQNLLGQAMSNPFLLISQSQNNQPILKSPIIQSHLNSKKQSQKKKKQIILKKQKNSNQKNQYWSIIKIQQKQIENLKKKIIQLQKNNQSPLSEETYKNDFQLDQLLNSYQKQFQRKNNHIQLTNFNSLEKQSKHKNQGINLNGKFNKKLNIKIPSKVLPVRQIFLTSPSHNSELIAKTLKFSNQKISSTKKSKQKRQNKILSSPKQFILTDHRQQDRNKLIEIQLRQISKKLDKKNEYQKFQKNILLRQIQLLFDEKMKQLPQNDLKNQFEIKQQKNKKVTLCQTNQLLISQIRYIQYLQNVLNHYLSDKFESLQKTKNIVPKKVKLYPKNIR